MPWMNIGYSSRRNRSSIQARPCVKWWRRPSQIKDAQARSVYAAYAEPARRLTKLAAERRFEAILQTSDGHNLSVLEVAADALRLPAWTLNWRALRGEKRRVALCRLLSAPDMLR
jgi:ATPase subunit of ABC transporter with duplicated ATPase domains